MSTTPATPLLDGITVLNLASVGPAARASRTLADYGATVVQVGPLAKAGTVQIQPPFHTYGAGRGFQYVSINMKSESGKEAFLRLAAEAERKVRDDHIGSWGEAISKWHEAAKLAEAFNLHKQKQEAEDWVNFARLVEYALRAEAEGRVPNAREYWRKAHEMKPDHPTVRKALLRLGITP